MGHDIEAKARREKAKDIFNKGLVSLEILKLGKPVDNVEEADALYDDIVKHKTYIVDDVSDPYLIRVAWTEKKKELKSVDPEFLDDIDKFEIAETIQDILREQGFPVINSNFPEAPKDVKVSSE